MIPDTIEQWTLETVQALAQQGVLENDTFDFKADLQPADHQRKTVAAFANTRRGFLAFGVTTGREGRTVFVCHLPPSRRGSHAVTVNNVLGFFKRGASSSCVPATFEGDTRRLLGHGAQKVGTRMAAVGSAANS